MKNFLDTLTDAQLELLSKTSKSGLDSLNDAELGELKRLNERAVDFDMLEKTPNPLAIQGPIDATIRALDYPLGLVRTGVGAGIAAGRKGYEMATGAEPKQVIKEGDLQRALSGKAPSLDEYLQRADVGELGNVKGITGRGTIGFLGELGMGLGLGAGAQALRKGTGLGGKILGNALTLPEQAIATSGGLLAKGTASVPWLGKFAEITTRPLRAMDSGGGALSGMLDNVGSPNVGKEMYRNAFNATDFQASKFGKGKNAVSDTLFKYGVSGGAEDIAAQSKSLISMLAEKQKDILKKATEMGATVDIEKTLKPIVNQTRAIKKSRISDIDFVKKATSVEELIQDLIDKGKSLPELKINPTRGMQESLLSNVDDAGLKVSQRAVYDFERPISQTGGIAPDVAAQRSLFPDMDTASKRISSPVPYKQSFEFAPEALPRVSPLMKTQPRTVYSSVTPEIAPYKGYASITPEGMQKRLVTSEGGRGGFSTKGTADNLFGYELPEGTRNLDEYSKEWVVSGELPRTQQPLPGFNDTAGIRSSGDIVVRDAVPNLSALEASKLKTRLGGKLNESAYADFGKIDDGDRLFKNAQNAVRTKVEQSVKKVSPELGMSLKEGNKDMGNLLTVLKKLDSEAYKEVTKNAATQVSGGLLGMVVAGVKGAPEALGMSQAAKALNSPAFLTKTGAALSKNPNAVGYTSKTLATRFNRMTPEEIDRMNRINEVVKRSRQ